MEREWPLIIFTLFICAGSGIMFVQGVLALRGKGRRMQVGSLVTSLVILAIGGIAVFTHLQHWERIFNGFGHLTSGITQELIGVVLIVIAIILYFLFMRRTEDGMAPKWVAIVAIVMSCAMVFIMAHSYNMPARMAWNTFMLEVFYLVNMVLLGALISLVIAYATKSRELYHALTKTTLIAAIVQVVVVVAYAIVLNLGTWVFADVGYYFDPTLPDVAMVDVQGTMMGIFIGSDAVLFWGGAIVCMGVVPIVLMLLLLRAEKKAGEAEKAPAEAEEDELALDDPLGRVILNILKSIPGGCKAAVKNTNWQTWVSILGVIIGSLCWRVILYDTALTVFAIFLH